MEQRASRALQVPFLDLQPSTEPIRTELMDAVAELLETGAFTNGPQVAQFEAAFAAFCGAPYCVGLASGFDALRLALAAHGVGPGDEVIVPANTFIATLEVVSQIGAKPVLVDASEADWNIDPGAAAAAVSNATRAIIPVHLYGQMADLEALHELAARHDLLLIEDACQAHGARRDGVRAGTRSEAAAFSFYPSKNLGAIGDAGALVTANEGVASQVRALREHGQCRKFEHEAIGFTARLDTIQAIALLLKLPLLEGWNEERRSVAAYYQRELGDLPGIRLLPVPPESEPAWYAFPVRLSARDELASFLATRGIGVGFHYPIPPHLTPAYAGLGLGRGSFPVTEALAEETLSLPIFPGMTEEQLELVVRAIREFAAA